MADRRFTVKDLLQEIGAELNVPPFMEGRQQLSAKDVQEGRRIASLRIHVERAIGRIKTFTILKQTLPINLAGSQIKLFVYVHTCQTSNWFLFLQQWQDQWRMILMLKTILLI